MTTQLNSSWAKGQVLPDLTIESISRTTLALFAGASGDHNPVHIDIDAAKAAGFDDVFAHGMLVMAYLGRAVSQWAPQLALHSYQVRFVKITQVGDRLRCRASVSNVAIDNDGHKRIELELAVSDAADEIKVAGTASYILHSAEGIES